MSEAEANTEPVLYRIKHSQSWQRRQRNLAVGLQHLIVNIARIEANNQVCLRKLASKEATVSAVYTLYCPPCVIRHCYAKTKEVLVLPPPNVLGAFLRAQREIEVTWHLDVLRCGALGHACEGWNCLPQQPLEKVHASLTL